MNRTVLSTVVVLFVGLFVGSFLIGPWLTSPATAQEKKAVNAGKGKCVAAHAVPFGKDKMTFYRAFEDGTVEFYTVEVRNLPPTKWAPNQK